MQVEKRASDKSQSGILRLKELNIQKEAEKFKKKKKRVEAIPVAVAQEQVQKRLRGPCAEVYPEAMVTQTGTQRAWGFLLVPLLGDVWLYGLLHVTSSIVVDLAIGPL